MYTLPKSWTISATWSLALLTLCWLASGSGTSRAQTHTDVPNATVKADTLAVYSGMRPSSAVLKSLNKGDQVILDFEIKSSTEKWCGVRLLGQARMLGYVQCQGLQRVERPVVEQPPDAGSSRTRGSSKQSAAGLALTPPSAHSATGYDEVAGLVVREGSINIVKLADLEAAARSGSAVGMTRAALAHLAAGSFELSGGNTDQAIEHYRAALTFAGRQPNLLLVSLLDLAYVHLQRSEYSTALEYLGRARRVAPRSAAVAQLAGWAYYGLNRVDQAIEEWKGAQRIQPNRGVALALEKAERDKEAENDFREEENSHFILHYHGGATPQLASEILHTLEDHFRSIQSELHFAPAEPIGVILYTQEAFADITRAPGWARGMNDGRIRVPVQGLASVSTPLSRVLKHELTHSFIQQRTLGRCPQWLNEGLAQWIEGRRTGNDAQPLIAVYERERSVPWRFLEGSWAGLPDQAVRFAYAWSLASVESIIADSGMAGIERLLESLGTESSIEAALRAALHTTYADLEQETAKYLRRTYPQ
jgi:tetratricopeptide (TPR) repeat protein